MRVFELADDLGVRSVEVLDACDDVGLGEKDAGADLSDDEVKRVRFSFHQRATAELMSAAAEVERLRPPTPPPPAPAPGVVDPGSYGQEPQSPWQPLVRPTNKGMHPLIKQSIWYMVLAHVIPCVGLYFFVSSVLLAGKGRRQIRWSNARYGGDTAGLVIQVIFWVELAAMVVGLCVAIAVAASAPPPQ
jgi:hypothetical protein